MGIVYRAEDKRIGRQVAIKTLTEGFSGQADMLERFYREAQAGILQHPNIVVVYDLGDQDGVPFIVMEYVNGDPLDKIISSGKPLPLIDKLSIIEQVCAALGYAHQRGVIHRDIKPANVIVQPDGHAKIVDFGIARIQTSSAETGLTRTGNVIGTIHYIAPERLRGLPFDGRSDIFSTGVMLYLLLTGTLPFAGEDIAVLQKLVNEPHPPLNTRMSGYPPYLDTILDRALAKDPDHRYSTAEEFAADLRALSEDLNRSRVADLFNDAERLTADQQFVRAREVLQQIIRIDAQHTGARQLLGIVQQNLSRQQRAEQLRQLTHQADEAMAASRFTEALASLEQAVKLDTTNTDLQAKLESAREKKGLQDEIASLMTQAEASRKTGDLPSALRFLEKALHLDQTNTKIRAAHAEFSKQAQIAAQQGRFRELLSSAQQELSSRRFTAAIEILREAGKIDPVSPELERLLNTAVTGQDQERRRKLLNQVQNQVESCLAGDDFDRAAEIVSRAIEQLPADPSLLQLKKRVDGAARSARVKHLVEITLGKAQELFANSPHEALVIVQRALQEVPGEERLLALEDSLRQRLRSLKAEEVRGRCLREAQEAINHNQFEKAIGILESYQVEFADTTGVSELLEFARTELAQQQRRERIASVSAQAQSLIEQERIDEAIRLLEPAAAERGDSGLQRLLTEARVQQEGAARRLQALLSRIKGLRDRGQLDEAIRLLEAAPAANAKGTLLNAMLAELRNENARKQALVAAVGAASQALERLDFHAGLDALQSVRQAYGDSEEISRVIADYETRRGAIANERLGKSVEAARAALLANDSAAAAIELQQVATLVEFADTAQQADWRRLSAEAGKPPARRTIGNVAAEEAAAQTETARRSKLPIIAVAGGSLVVVAALVLFLLLGRGHKPAPANSAQPTAATPAAPATGTLKVRGNLADVDVFVDGTLKGFTQSDGTLALPLDAGAHTVRFTKADYEDLESPAVTISANNELNLPFSLKPLTGAAPPATVETYLTLHSVPGGALVTIDKVPAGKTDAQGNLIAAVKPGRRSVQITMDNYQPFNESVNVKAGEKKPLTAALIPNKPSSSQPASNSATAPPAAAPQPVQIVSFSASPSSIEEGQSTTLQWTTTNANEVSIDNGIDRVAVNGHTPPISPAANTTYTLTAKGSGGTQQATTTVAVARKPTPPPPQPSTPAPTAEASPHPADESAALRSAITRYQSAYNDHDIGRIRAAWPSLSPGLEKDMRNVFKEHPEIRLNVDCSSSPSLSGDSALWGCRQTITVTSNGKQVPSSRNASFSFARKDGNWVISGLK